MEPSAQLQSTYFSLGSVSGVFAQAGTVASAGHSFGLDGLHCVSCSITIRTARLPWSLIVGRSQTHCLNHSTGAWGALQLLLDVVAAQAILCLGRTPDS